MKKNLSLINKDWTEKYRPKTLQEYIGNDLIKTKFQEYIDDKIIPNILLEGGPGGGKTSASFILINSLDCDVLKINGSDENGINTVRNKIIPFISTHSFKQYKIVFIDEFDGFSAEAFDVLRHTIEKYESYCRFICTCNYVNKIPEVIRSRFSEFKVIPPTKSSVAEKLSFILDLESIKYKTEDLVTITNKYYPDLRKCIKVIQQSSKNKEINLDGVVLEDMSYFEDILQNLKKKDKSTISSIRQILLESVGDSSYLSLYKLLFDNIEKYGKGKETEIMILINSYQYKHNFVLDKEMNCISLFCEILNVIK